MPNPVSADIRTRFEALFARGLAGREMHRRLMVSGACASRLSQKCRPGLGLRIDARTFIGLFNALSETRDPFTPHECCNCFCEAG